MQAVDKPRYVVWDWNGTLFDDAAVCLHVMNSLLTDRNLSPLSNLAAYRAIFGFPVSDFYERAGLCFDVEPFEALAHTYIARYHTQSQHCTLHTGTKETLARVQAGGLTQIILSASKTEHLLRQLAPFQIREYFDAILGLNNVYAKSKVAVAQAWLAQCHISPAQLVLVGDTVHDHEVACALNCSCVLIANGHQDAATLRACKCVVLHDIAQIPALLCG